MPDYIPTVFTSKATLLANIPTRIYQNFLRLITGTVHQEMDMDMAASLWREFTAPLALDTATGIVKLADGTASGNVLQWNSVTNTWNQVQAKTNKIIWVDAIYGVDGTAQVYNPFRPYQTIDAAQTAAVSGDLIHVRPGAYTTTNGIGKDGVNWYFDAGATTSGQILGTAVNITYSIYGQGVFVYTHAYGNLVYITSTTANITIYAKSITATGTTNAGAVQNTTGSKLTIYADLFGVQYGIQDGGILTVHGNVTATVGSAVTSSGTTVINGNVTSVSLGAATSVTGATITINGNVTATSTGLSSSAGTITVNGSVTANAAVLANNTGYCRVNGAVTGSVTTTVTATSELNGKVSVAGPMSVGATAKLILGATARVVCASGTYCTSATAGAVVISYGAYSTKAQDPAVTLNGTLNVGAYVQ